jgi:tetratricopeptide (TPR) repeat protein
LYRYDRDGTDALALALLARAAYFAPGEPVPHDLLLASARMVAATASPPHPPSTDDPEMELMAEDAADRLLNLGLLEEESEGALRLHHLLAVFVRAVSTDAEAQAAVEGVLLKTAGILNNQGDPRPLLQLQTHVRVVTEAARHRLDEQAAGLCNVLGVHLYMIGDYTGARAYHEQALAINQQVLGETHPQTAQSLNNLGGVLQAQGDLTACMLLTLPSCTFPERANADRNRE